jgi:hypothetical protein
LFRDSLTDPGLQVDISCAGGVKPQLDPSYSLHFFTVYLSKTHLLTKMRLYEYEDSDVVNTSTSTLTSASILKPTEIVMPACDIAEIAAGSVKGQKAAERNEIEKGKDRES